MSGTISSFVPSRPEPTQPVVLTVAAGGGTAISSVSVSVLLPGMESPEVAYTTSGGFTGNYTGYSATWGSSTSRGFSLLRQHGWTNPPVVSVEATYDDGLVLVSSNDGSSSTTPGNPGLPSGGTEDDVLTGDLEWTPISSIVPASDVTSVFGRTGTVAAESGDYSKGDVGLGNVDNTSDVDKPVSSAQQTALDGKVPTTRTVAGAALSGDVSAATIAVALGLGTVTATGADLGAVRALLFPDPAGPFSTSDYLGGATTTGVVEPRLGPSRALAFSLYKRTNVLGQAHVVITHIDNYGAPSRGWFLHFWSTGDMAFTLVGMSGVFSLGNWDSLSVGRHVFAINFFDTGAGIQGRYSVDGGAIQTTATRTGTYVPPTTADTLWMGRSAEGGYERPMTCADLYQIIATSTSVSDADLILLSAASGEFPTVATGTVSYSFSVPRDLIPGYTRVRSSTGGWTIIVNNRIGRRPL